MGIHIINWLYNKHLPFLAWVRYVNSSWGNLCTLVVNAGALVGLNTRSIVVYVAGGTLAAGYACVILHTRNSRSMVLTRNRALVRTVHPNLHVRAGF